MVKEVIKLDKQTCKSCQYYHQHYAFSEGCIHRAFCGHCTFGRCKTKRPYTAACENYIYTAPDENAFVSKEYLSKALLLRVLNMELLPPIEEERI